MSAQYNRKRELTQAGALSWIYREFPLLSEYKETELMDQIRSHISAKRYIESVSTSCTLLICRQ
jgi:predicted HD phosphohydrolase